MFSIENGLEAGDIFLADQNLTQLEKKLVLLGYDTLPRKTVFQLIFVLYIYLNSKFEAQLQIAPSIHFLNDGKKWNVEE